MRTIWIATGVVFSILALAALLRSNRVENPVAADVALDHVTVPAVTTTAMDPPPVDPQGDLPRPLAAEDVARIVSLREELADANGLEGPVANGVEFERELRHVAGLEAVPEAAEWADSAVPAPQKVSLPVTQSGDHLAAGKSILREAAVSLDELANRCESVDDYEPADELRALGNTLRVLARQMNSSSAPSCQESLIPGSDTLPGLIDNGQDSQAQ